MRNISFALTTPQFRARSKDVTRRLGWKNLKPGTVLMGVVKSQGLGKGGKIQRLGPIEVVSVRHERLDEIEYLDAIREGFPEMTEDGFVAMFCQHMRCEPCQVVTRIEFRYLDEGGQGS